MSVGVGGRVARATIGALQSRPIWLGLGFANVAAGVVIAVRPAQSQDLRLVVSWCRQWLIEGITPYPGPDFTTNYPPYAIAFLSPLAWLSHPLLEGVWAVANAALAVVVSWLGLRIIPDEVRGNRYGIIPLGFFLTWESLRIGLGNGQFTLLALAAGLAAVACRGRVSRGILLAIAMIKPQVGLAFGLWAAMEGSFTAILIAGAVMAAGVILFSVRLAQNVWGVVADYTGVLRQQFGGPVFKQGALELRPLLHDLIGQRALAEALHLAILAGSLAVLVWASRRMSSANRSMFLLPLTCLWTLMSVYHLTYDLVLLWPVLVALSSGHVLVKRKPIVLGVLFAMQLALMIDIPGLWWKLNGRAAFPDHEGAIITSIHHFDRLMVVALFVTLVTISTTRRDLSPASQPLWAA